MHDYDVLVIGSGFGGSVAALRLTEKGYKVGVIEAGARFADEDFAKTSFDTRRFLFRPEIGCYGIQRIDALKDCLILSGAGVGGGSLVYANTLYEPLDQFYDDPSWKDITDWRAELAPYFDQAKRMLGVATYPRMTPSDKVMLQIATDLGVADSFHATPRGSGCASTVWTTLRSPQARRSAIPTSAGPDRTATPACTAANA
jgi:cholesterol oxidase